MLTDNKDDPPPPTQPLGLPAAPATPPLSSLLATAPQVAIVLITGRRGPQLPREPPPAASPPLTDSCRVTPSRSGPPSCPGCHAGWIRPWGAQIRSRRCWIHCLPIPIRCHLLRARWLTSTTPSSSRRGGVRRALWPRHRLPGSRR